MPFPYEEFDLSDVRTYPLASRASKTAVADFAKPFHKGAGVASLSHSAYCATVFDANLPANRCALRN